MTTPCNWPNPTAVQLRIEGGDVSASELWAGMYLETATAYELDRMRLSSDILALYAQQNSHESLQAALSHVQ